MKRIRALVDKIDDEINDAENSAEDYVYYKSKGNTALANRMKEVANDELKHSTYYHDIVVAEIDEVSKVYTPPVEMMEKWDKAHKLYVERVAKVKQMLTM